MHLRRYVIALATAALFSLTIAGPAKAAENTDLPNLVSVGAGWFDFNKNSPQREAVDMRLEHRWGMSLLPMANNYFKSWDPYFQIHPMVAIETTNRGQFYGAGGFALDFLLGRHIVITQTELVGLYYRGDGKRLGSFVEFRSTFEAGFRFENEMRLTGFIGHTSNAGLTDLNPGANTIGGYLHIPTNILSGR